MKLLCISPEEHAVRWVLYDHSFDRVYLAGIARLTTDDTIGRDLALESWILQVLDQYSRMPGIQEVVLELDPERGQPLPRLPLILKRRCQLWQLKLTEMPTPSIYARLVGDGEASPEVLSRFLRSRFATVLDRLDVSRALAAALAWKPARLSWFGRRK